MTHVYISKEKRKTEYEFPSLGLPRLTKPNRTYRFGQI